MYQFEYMGFGMGVCQLYVFCIFISAPFSPPLPPPLPGSLGTPLFWVGRVVVVGFLGLPARFLVPIPLLSLVEVLICFSLAYSVQCSPVKYHPVSMFFSPRVPFYL